MFHGVRLNGGVALSDVAPHAGRAASRNGYRCGGFVGAFVLDSRWGLNQGFEAYDDEFDLKPGEHARPRAACSGRATRSWTQRSSGCRAADERPFFAWVHLYDPHTPYEPPEPYRTRFAGGPSRRYDGEIAFADSQVGRLLDWLRSSGKDERTIVVVIGDHGEGLGSHREEEHGFFIYDYAVRVPLIVRLPGGRRREPGSPRRRGPSTSCRPCSTCSASHHRRRLDGESLRAVAGRSRGARERRTPTASRSRSACSTGGAPCTACAPRVHLHRRSAPGALRPPAGPRRGGQPRRPLPNVAEELRATLAQLREEGAKGAPDPQEANLDEETMRALASPRLRRRDHEHRRRRGPRRPQGHARGLRRDRGGRRHAVRRVTPPAP